MPAAFTPSPSIGANDPPLLDGPPTNATTARELLNNRRFLRGATWGALTWSGRLVVGGSATAPSITVGAIEAVTLRDGAGVWRPYFKDTETVLGIGDVEGAPASLSADTWHYVYAHDSAGSGSPRFQVSTTAPGTSLAWKNAGGTALYRYLGCFPTDDTGTPVPLVAHRGRYVYRRSASTTQTRVLNLSADAPTNTDLSLAGLVPPHARIARLYLNINVGTFNLYAKPDTASPHFSIVVPSGAIHTAETAIECDASQAVQYTFTSHGNALVYVAGFEE